MNIESYTTKIEIMDNDISELLVSVECFDAGVAKIIPPAAGLLVCVESWPEIEAHIRNAIKEVCK